MVSTDIQLLAKNETKLSFRLAGAVVATAVGVWWGLTPSPSEGHHGDDHGDEHGSHDKHEETEDKPKAVEVPAEQKKAAESDDGDDSKPNEAKDKEEGESKDDKKEEQKGKKKTQPGETDKPTELPLDDRKDQKN